MHYNIESRIMNRDCTISDKYPSQLKLNIALYALLSEYNGILESIGTNIRYTDINTLVKKPKGQSKDGYSFIVYLKKRI